MSAAPVVSVVTPFYNTERYLAECIESVLEQTFTDFEYVLADNASTDGSLEIARSYARQDPRVRVHAFDEHLAQHANYNRALGLARREARYCKVVQADDALLPACLEEMVRLAESDDRIGMVGAYTVLQDSVFLDGLDFHETVVNGRELCRRYLLGGPYIFGNPTTCLYRMREVRTRPDFYPTHTVMGDTEVAVQILDGADFGFVHQVLSFVRTENDSVSTRLTGFGIDPLTRRILLEKYGERFLEPDELARERRRLRRRHYRVLGEGLLLRKPRRFWALHRAELAQAGLKIRPFLVVVGALVMAVRLSLNLEGALRGTWHWRF
jgi:glycosyltransferase involved in cell wall biosynthesis